MRGRINVVNEMETRVENLSKPESSKDKIVCKFLYATLTTDYKLYLLDIFNVIASIYLALNLALMLNIHDYLIIIVFISLMVIFIATSHNVRGLFQKTGTGILYKNHLELIMRRKYIIKYGDIRKMDAIWYSGFSVSGKKVYWTIDEKRKLKIYPISSIWLNRKKVKYSYVSIALFHEILAKKIKDSGIIIEQSSSAINNSIINNGGF